MTTFEQSFGVIPITKGVTGVEVLLVQQQKDGKLAHWSFPKGHSEEGETEFETALRELREETGILLPESRLLKKDVLRYDYNFMGDDGFVHKEAVFFPAFVSREEEVLPIAPDVAKVRWMNFATAKELVGFESARDFVLRVEEWLFENFIESNT